MERKNPAYHEITTKEDIRDALEKQLGPLGLQDSGIRGLRKAYGGKINLNHCEVAQDLFSQTIYEAAIISEPYRNNRSGAWTADVTGKAAIWVCGN